MILPDVFLILYFVIIDEEIRTPFLPKSSMKLLFKHILKDTMMHPDNKVKSIEISLPFGNSIDEMITLSLISLYLDSL